MIYKSVLIVVENVARSRYLYETILGQKVVGDFGENISFAGFSIHQRNHFENLIRKKVHYRSNCCELYFETTEDLFEIEKIITLNKLEIIHGVIEQPWKQKAIRFYDYDENLIEIGESFKSLALRLK